MSAANFITMRDFPLFVRDFYIESKRCPSCGTIQDLGNDLCEFCDSEDKLEEYDFFDEWLCNETCNDVSEKMENLNRELLFHHLKVESGYYSGIQLYVEVDHDLTEYEYNNDDCHYYFDCCKSMAYRKYEREIRKICRMLKALASEFKFEEIVCVGRFSNGEAVYAPANNERARLYATVR